MREFKLSYQKLICGTCVLRFKLLMSNLRCTICLLGKANLHCRQKSFLFSETILGQNGNIGHVNVLFISRELTIRYWKCLLLYVHCAFYHSPSISNDTSY